VRPASGNLQVVPVKGRHAVRDWLALPHAVFADDPAWVAPLDFVERRRISHRAPFFAFGEAALWVAYRGPTPVGRISAQINRRHLERYADGTGHFGFFHCFDDYEAAAALVSTAAAWLRERGMVRMVGPMNFSLNDECGCLVAGFDTPPAMLMTHARAWEGRLLEQTGLRKEVDLFAYRHELSVLSARSAKLMAMAGGTRDVSLRPFDMTRFTQEVTLLVEIFNDAWSDNWGFVPFSPIEVKALASEIRPFFRGEYGRFLLVRGEPVGVFVVLPNLNEIIAPFHGKLLPFNWAKLVWRLKREKVRSFRIPLIGIQRKWQSTPVGGLLLAALVRDIVRQAQRYDADWLEYSWVVETNTQAISAIETVTGPPVKTYRIYAKTL